MPRFCISCIGSVPIEIFYVDCDLGIRVRKSQRSSLEDSKNLNITSDGEAVWAFIERCSTFLLLLLEGGKEKMGVTLGYLSALPQERSVSHTLWPPHLRSTSSDPSVCWSVMTRISIHYKQLLRHSQPRPTGVPFSIFRLPQSTSLRRAQYDYP